MKNLFIAALLFCAISAEAQVKIGDNPATINPNSLLEMESSNKGFLAPRVTLTSLTSVSPLSGTVPAGMLVYNAAGSLTYGYYYWDGTEWKFISNGNLNTVVKTANATLTKSENFVLASNDIIVTLPAVTNADNGLTITVKNNGVHTDLVTVKGNGGATLDGQDSTNLSRWVSKIFIAHGGNWFARSSINSQEEHVLEVDENSSWVTLQEAIEFLDVHMTEPVIIRLGHDFELTQTIDINLPYPLTIQGLSYGVVSINAGTGLTGNPMFRCLSECYFKMLSFDATTLANYGTVQGEDCIRFLGSGTYNEVKDCSFDGFYNTILDSTNAELWVFETDIMNANGSGILIHGAVAGVTVKVAETDFIACNYGINLSKGSSATIQLASGGYYNANAGDTAIFYQPANFTSFNSISITGNTWNNVGVYIEGFDFTRTDGRDANAIVESNAGSGDKRPNCFINVLNSSTTKTLTTSGTWYKSDWGTNTSSETCKLTISDNKITYQPTNRRDALFTVSGNLSVNSSSQNISIGIVKNGNSSVRYGETTLRVTTSDQPFQFSFIAYLPDVSAGDYFEIYYSNASSNGKVVKIQDIQWYANTQ